MIRDCIQDAYAQVSRYHSPQLYEGRERRAAAGTMRRAIVARNIEERFSECKLPFECISNQLGTLGNDSLVMVSLDRKIVFSCKKVDNYGEMPPNSNLRSSLRMLNEQNPLGIEFQDKLTIPLEELELATYVLITYGPSSEQPEFLAFGVPMAAGNSWVGGDPVRIPLDNQIRMQSPTEEILVESVPVLKPRASEVFKKEV